MMFYSPTTTQVYADSDTRPGDAVPLTLALVMDLLGSQHWKSWLEVDGTTPAEPFRVIVKDQQSLGSAFLLGASFEMARVGGTGHREALTGRMTTDSAPSGEFAVAVSGVAMVRTGSGNAFGVGGYAQVNAEADGTAEAVGGEMNTDVRRNVVRKVGLQAIDAASSTGYGTVVDAGVLVAAQPGGVGYSVGLKFGLPNGFGIRTGGTLIYAETTTNVPRAGLDFSAVAFGLSPIILKPNNGGILFGGDGAGGAIRSETTTGGGAIVFGNGAVGIRFGGALAFYGTTQETWVNVLKTTGGSIFRRLIAGPENSAGDGYRIVKVEN